ncbi:hypothetical protein JL722_8845 [Aureococcus anophagefferens]|nr:hypothetical protein JL722_8845 [Aureococcus anophagefferens]
MDLDDDEQEQAAKAKRKLKRRSKKKSAKAKNAAGAAPHAPSRPGRGGRAAPRPLPKIRVFPQLSEVQKARLRMKDQEHIRRAARLHEAVTQEQERNAFLERIQAEEVRREQARIAAARPVPPPPNRATGAGDDSDEGWEESDEDDPVEDLIHRERIRERDLLRTPGCLALGRKAFRLEDMPRASSASSRTSTSASPGPCASTSSSRPSTRSRSTRTSSSRADMEVRRSTVGVYEDSLACQLLGQTYYVHPDKTIKITVDLVVTSEVIGAFRARDGRRSARDRFLAGTAPGRAEVQIKELGFHFIDPLAPIAEKEIVPRVRVDDGHLIVELKYLQAMHVKNRMLKKCCYTLYLLELADRLRGEASRETLKTARKNVVEAEGEYQLALSNYRQMELWCFFKVAAPAGPPLKALEAMTAKECNAELDAAGVPKKGRSVANTTIGILRDLVRRLRAGEPAASLTVPRKPKSAEELFVLDKAEQLACRARTRRPSTSIFRARTLFSSQATLVADGAKKVVFSTGAKNANGTDYLKARFRGLGETDPPGSSSTSSRRDVAAAAADELPVDRLQRVPDPGLVNLPTIWPRMRFPSAS